MNKKEMRETAIGAARSQARRNGCRPENLSAKEALGVLDDIYRVDPQVVASIWYGNASDNQIKLFCREWNAWREWWLSR